MHHVLEGENWVYSLSLIQAYESDISAQAKLASDNEFCVYKIWQSPCPITNQLSNQFFIVSDVLG